MVTIKSYTDLEQSRKLAEILPIESADMAWGNNSIKGINYVSSFSANLYTVKEMEEAFDKVYCDNGYRRWDKYWKLIPCWSLVALLNVIPKEIFNGEYVINITDGLDNKWIITYDTCNSSSFYGLVSSSDNIIDSCVDIIEKLHKLKIL